MQSIFIRRKITSSKHCCFYFCKLALNFPSGHSPIVNSLISQNNERADGYHQHAARDAVVREADRRYSRRGERIPEDPRSV